MANQKQVAKQIEEAWGKHILSIKELIGETVVTFKEESKEQLVAFCSYLKEDPLLDFDFLAIVTAVDYLDFPEYPDHDCRFEGIYQIFSLKKKHHVRVKVPIEDDGNPSVPSVCSIWKSAEFHEDEAFDMYGIDYTGHPELRRLYMPPDWKGHPLRKDYGLTEGQDYGVNKVRAAMEDEEIWKLEEGKRLA